MQWNRLVIAGLCTHKAVGYRVYIQVDGLETLAVFEVSRTLQFSGNLTSPSGDGLRLQHFEVKSSVGHQLGVCARLHHDAVPDEGDAVSRLDGGQSPSDDDARASLASLVQRVQHDLHVGTDSTCWVKGSLVAGECNFPGNQTHAEFEISTGPVVHLVDDH